MRKRINLNRKQILALPFSERYTAYLKSQYWLKFRKNVLAHRGRICEECKTATRKVHVHHLTYDRLGHEVDSDVQVLCEACHDAKHKTKVSRR